MPLWLLIVVTVTSVQQVSTLVGDGAQVTFLQVTGAIGIKQFLEVLDLGLELGADVGIVHKDSLMGVLDNAARGLNVLTESHGLVNR